MNKTEHATCESQAVPAVGRPLREGEVIGAYIDFDRTADRAWSNAEYIVRFGEFVSQRTVEVMMPQIPNEFGHLLTPDVLWNMYGE